MSFKFLQATQFFTNKEKETVSEEKMLQEVEFILDLEQDMLNRNWMY